MDSPPGGFHSPLGNTMDAQWARRTRVRGEDKPLKYPLMFRACDLVLVNKIDLLPHLRFDLDLFLYRLEAAHPGMPRLFGSAHTGEGVDAWCDWLVAAAARGRAVA